jgi:hypothetical protein
MTQEDIQNQAIETYRQNMAYLKQKEPKLYERLVLFDEALNQNLTQSVYELEYKDGYFDALNTQTKQFYYGTNAIKYSQKVVNGITFEASNNSFKTFYEHKYTDEFVQKTQKSSILSSYDVSIAPIVHYVNSQLPSKEVLKSIYKFIIFGAGLGYHIALTHEKINARLYLIVEPSLELFRLSLFVTNYAKLASKTALLFAIAQDENEFKETFDCFYQEFFILNHYFKFVMFSDTCMIYTHIIQNVLVSQPHYLYAFNRYFQSLKRTNEYIYEDFPVLNVASKHHLKSMHKPILFLGAGPSLQNEIEFVKKNQDRFMIVAIYATMPLLEEHGIVPDIITQYDEQDAIVLSTLKRVKSLEFFKKTLFIFSSHIDSKLMNAFSKEQIFIFQALFELKSEHGVLSSPSIGEITYALLLLLGAQEIYMLGIDMALDDKTNSTHIQGHAGANAFAKQETQSLDDTNYSFRKNIITVKGNWQSQVKTMPVFKTLRDCFNLMTQRFNDSSCKVFNFSKNGAYFEQTTPLDIETFEVQSLKFLEKKALEEALKSDLNSIASKQLQEKDKALLQQKQEDARDIQHHLDEFYRIKKHGEIEKYKQHVVAMLQQVLYHPYRCIDLQKMMHNYVSYTLHHIFYLLELQSVSNHKRHMKKLSGYLYEKLSQIVHEYIKSIQT